MKLTPDTENHALLVSIDGTRGSGGSYVVITAYPVREAQVTARLKAGTLAATQ